MTEWKFWGDRQVLSVYGNIYLRTNIEDWFKIINIIVKEFKGSKFLDIGCGEGHTTKQILDRINKKYYCDLVEPNKKALLFAKRFLSFENNPRRTISKTLNKLDLKEKYDTVFTSHTNYYWAKSEGEFNKQLLKFVHLIGKKGVCLILTLPRDSDHYKIMLKRIYPKFNYSDYIKKFYKQQAFKIKSKKLKMRMFIGDILESRGKFELYNFYKFIHNTDKNPSKKEAREFLKKLKKFQRGGYLDFKDELIIIKN